MAFPRLDRLDTVFLSLGGIGLVLFLVLLPSQHPDAAGTFGIGAEEVVEQSRTYLEERGYSLDRLDATVRFSRSPRLIDSLQASLGRRGTIVALQEGYRERIPAFVWLVEWYLTPEAEARPAEPTYRARVFPGGEVWDVHVSAEARADRPVDIAVLRRAFAPDFETHPDSRLSDALRFDLESPVEAEEIVDVRPALAELLRAADGEPTVLGAGAAAALARAHVERTALGNLPLEVSSVEALPARGRAAARVHLTGSERVLGQTVDAEVDVLASGTLLGIRTRFNETDERTHAPGTMSLETTGASYRDVLKYGGWVVLILFLLWVAVSRLSVRALDTRAALRDALVVAVFSAVSLVLFAPSFPMEAVPGPMSRMLLIGVMVAFNAGLLGVLAFVTTAGGDALARSHSDRPLRTLALVRESRWMNVPVGRALIRGAGLGAALVGAVALAMTVFSAAPVPAGTRFVESQLTLSLFGTAVADHIWYVFVVTHAVLVGVGAVLARWRPSLVVPALGLALAILGVRANHLPGGSELLSWSLAIALGLGIAWAYVRTDALTMLLALLLASVLWSTREALLMPGSPATLDLAAALLLVPVMVALGLRGVASGTAGDNLPAYVPDFIAEQRERARMQRELEIARQVQQSLLPTVVPEVQGIDLAARCVPAEEVGGDYYDLLPLGPGKLAVVIGDVSGKGIEAAFYMTLVKGYLQALAAEVEQPAAVLSRLNALFRESAPRGTFVSVIYAVMDMRRCTMAYARAGHTPLVVKRSGAAVRALRPAGMAIGMADQASFDRSIAEDELELCPDDLIVLYTDGLSEAMDRRRIQFSDERLAAIVDGAPAAAEAVLDAVLDGVRAHVGAAAQHDDLTMVAVRVAATIQAAEEPMSVADAHV